MNSFPPSELKTSKALPAPNVDFYELADTLSADERVLVNQVRDFVHRGVSPVINKYWMDDAFPVDLLPSFRKLNLGGLGLDGYGCRGGSQKQFGFILMELARGDASFATCDSALVGPGDRPLSH